METTLNDKFEKNNYLNKILFNNPEQTLFGTNTWNKHLSEQILGTNTFQNKYLEQTSFGANTF